MRRLQDHLAEMAKGTNRPGMHPEPQSAFRGKADIKRYCEESQLLTQSGRFVFTTFLYSRLGSSLPDRLRGSL
jgi:hypothetical protein